MDQALTPQSPDAGDRLARAEAEIERLTRELQALTLRLIEAQETERRHIARELHDQTGQTLTAAVLDLEFFKDKGVPPDEVGAVLATVKQALSEVRNISLQLRPPMLDDAGLEPALKVYLERQAASGKFDVSLAVEGGRRLAREIELTAFRLVQEAVTNILRHAGARHVDVSVRIGANELTLRVSDNGSGCVAQDALGNASGGMSLGLVSMRERAALVGGHCEFISAPAVGSMVLARLPIAG
jgi:signal transduction histidine kinase